MRHGESQNNVLAQISASVFNENRTAEPELSTKGIRDCRSVGARLAQLGIKVDLMLTSAQKRAILSLKHLRDTYDRAVPCQIFTEIHEEFGCYLGEQTFPGLKRSEVL